MHAAVLAVVATNMPGVQEEQLVEPEALAKLPVGQAMQEVVPVAGWW